MPEPIQIEGGEVLANLEDRTITGLVIPYGELGRTNVGLFSVEAGVIALPEDPAAMVLNLDHDRFQPVGNGLRVWEEPAGIMATFKIAKGSKGDAALADARDPNGKRRRFSGEFITGIKAGKATGGHLAASALVEQGAFPSAMVLAADTAPSEFDAPESSSSSQYVTEFTDEDGTKWRRVEESVRTTTVTKVSGDTEEEQEGTDVPETTTEVQATVDLPPTPGKTTPRGPDKREIFAAIATLKYRNPMDPAAKAVLAALSDVTIGGAGALPADGVIQQSWLSRIDLGIPYQREYLPLSKTGTDITAGGKSGFKFHRGTTGSPSWGSGTWAGNKSAINSGVGHTTKHESTLDMYARGADIGREFFDLPGGEDVIEAFLAELKTDHLQWSDERALQLYRLTAGVPIAPSVYPGVDGHDYAGAMGQLIQGILAVKRKKADKRRDQPTYAIANEVAFEELLYTPKDLVPEFVEFIVNPDGTATVQGRSGGKVVVVEGDTGIEATSSVIVGADYAIEFDELPGGPLHVNALEIAKGGIDEAVHGYLQKFVRRPEALVHIGTTPNRANSTAYAEGALIKASAVVYIVVVAGTSHSSAPTAPAVGETVADGTATLLRLV
jgi:hypothetical protein